MTTWKQYVLPTVGFSISAVLCLMAVLASIPQHKRLAFLAYWIPVIFVCMALILGWTLQTHNWASLWGTGFTVQTAGIYLGASFLIMAVQRPLTAAVLKSTNPAAVEGLRLALFRFPEFSPTVFRSVIGSPISEEFLFRGWLLTWFQNHDLSPIKVGRITLNAANVLASLSFAVFHITSGSVFNVIGVFFISLLLGSAKLKSGGVLLPMLCHALINLMNETYFVWVR
ncbi:MAG TPA: CPBP family intramembrane metalloprotease [Firmicutes bacterium]|nr:CPBP family intramembrane metalloprotease [Candidatus Fermentithermobacillaceae bacterium]